MLASVLIYGAAVLALLGLAALGAPRRFVGRYRRIHASMTIAVAVGVGLLGVGLPSRDVTVARPGSRLDTIMPTYQFHHRHSIRIAASSLEVDRAVRAVAADEIPLYRTLTWIRRFGRRGPESLVDAPPGVPLLTLATRTGFGLVADEPGRELVLATAGPVSSAARAAAASGAPRGFIASAEGYASIALSFQIVPAAGGGSMLSTETRVFAPDAETRRRLRTYWRVIYPGSVLIRRGWLDAIRRRAEGEKRGRPGGARSTPTGPAPGWLPLPS